MILAVVLLCALVPLAPLAIGISVPDIEFWWDFFMALGFVAAGGIVLLPVLTARLWRIAGHSPPLMTLVHHVHEYLSLALGVLIIAHAAGPIIREPLLVEYIKLTAPAYMLAGLTATLLFAGLLVLSFFRIRLATRYPVWRGWHGVLSAAAIVLMLIHIGGAGYYVDRPWKLWVLAVFALVLTVSGMTGARLQGRNPHSDNVLHSATELSSAVAGGRWMSLGLVCLWMAVAVLFAMEDDSAAEGEAAACEESACTPER